MLIQHLIRRAVHLGRRGLDFTIGDEPFKRRFTIHVRKTVDIRVFGDRGRHVFERARRDVIAAVRRAAAGLRQV